MPQIYGVTKKGLHLCGGVLNDKERVYEKRYGSGMPSEGESRIYGH
jgi:hypothetical protein